jgi:hypothetical protein
MRELLESVVTTGNGVGTAGPEDARVWCFCDAATGSTPHTSGVGGGELEKWSRPRHLSLLFHTHSYKLNTKV